MADIPRVTNARRLILYVTVVVVVGAAAFTAGTFISTPEESALEAADYSVPVSVKAEEREVSDYETIQGAVAAGGVVDVVAGVPRDAARAVVTMQPSAPGSSVAAGQALGSISDRPMLLISLPTPLQRDLRSGDTGKDVERFQAALKALDVGNVPLTGKVDSSTLKAVRTLYQRNGYAPVGATLSATEVRMDEFVSISTGAVTILESAPVGSILQPDGMFVRMQTVPNFVSARVSVLSVDKFAVGSEVRVQGDGSSDFTGTVTSVSSFMEPAPEQGLGAGHDLAIALAPEGLEALGVSDPVTITATGETLTALAVPLIAVRQGAAGPYVLVEDAEGRSVQVPVTILREGGGWVAIEPDERVDVDTEIQVSP